MSIISEFTGLSAIPPVGMPAKKNTLPKKKRSRAIDEFLANVTETEEAPAAPAAAAPVAAPAPAEKEQTPAPAAAPAEAPAPAAPSNESASKAILISKQVAESLMSGRSVIVRGVLLEPTFKCSAAPTPAAPPPAPRVESAADVMRSATGLNEAQADLSGGAVDINASQPPPAKTTEGKAVSAAFRRFGGPTMG